MKSPVGRSEALKRAALYRNRIDSALRASPNPVTTKELAEYLHDIMDGDRYAMQRLNAQIRTLLHEKSVVQIREGNVCTYYAAPKSEIPVKVEPRNLPKVRVEVDPRNWPKTTVEKLYIPIGSQSRITIITYKNLEITVEILTK